MRQLPPTRFSGSSGELSFRMWMMNDDWPSIVVVPPSTTFAVAGPDSTNSSVASAGTPRTVKRVVKRGTAT